MKSDVPPFDVEDELLGADGSEEDGAYDDNEASPMGFTALNDVMEESGDEDVLGGAEGGDPAQAKGVVEDSFSDSMVFNFDAKDKYTPVSPVDMPKFTLKPAEAGTEGGGATNIKPVSEQPEAVSAVMEDPQQSVSSSSEESKGTPTAEMKEGSGGSSDRPQVVDRLGVDTRAEALLDDSVIGSMTEDLVLEQFADIPKMDLSLKDSSDDSMGAPQPSEAEAVPSSESSAFDADAHTAAHVSLKLEAPPVLPVPDDIENFLPDGGEAIREVSGVGSPSVNTITHNRPPDRDSRDNTVAKMWTQSPGGGHAMSNAAPDQPGMVMPPVSVESTLKYSGHKPMNMGHSRRPYIDKKFLLVSAVLGLLAVGYLVFAAGDGDNPMALLNSIVDRITSEVESLTQTFFPGSMSVDDGDDYSDAKGAASPAKKEPKKSVSLSSEDAAMADTDAEDDEASSFSKSSSAAMASSTPGSHSKRAPSSQIIAKEDLKIYASLPVLDTSAKRHMPQKLRKQDKWTDLDYQKCLQSEKMWKKYEVISHIRKHGNYYRMKYVMDILKENKKIWLSLEALSLVLAANQKLSPSLLKRILKPHKAYQLRKWSRKFRTSRFRAGDRELLRSLAQTTGGRVRYDVFKTLASDSKDKINQLYIAACTKDPQPHIAKFCERRLRSMVSSRQKTQLLSAIASGGPYRM